MTKNVLFYARYSTDRQHEVSIEAQIELGEAFIKDRGWKLVATYSNAPISGTSYQLRPGIQSLMSHVRREQIDIVLCVTGDRLSRDLERAFKMLKEWQYRDIDLWTVHGA
ncbi:recombinase family protein [Agrobacterium tumefaciens]|uniref:recombinase family protein n=1 Tax=Agrobacterium tumefaciens TaxID=358 RepID=UPI001E6132FB|nr:recombinase family protein [Agrobacterium tumefaciens]